MSIFKQKRKSMLTINEINNLIPQTLRNKYNLTTDGLAMFLAQCDHESQGFTKFEENLNYSADRLLKVFPKYFTQNNVNDYAHNSVAIANYVYANRMGNGSIESGDGYKFRGRGLIQLTGKDNYTRCGKAIGVDLINGANLLLMLEYGLQSSFWFFENKGIINNINCEYVTKIINGGINGLDKRNILFHNYLNLLKD
jgi:putative chitinase